MSMPNVDPKLNAGICSEPAPAKAQRAVGSVRLKFGLKAGSNLGQTKLIDLYQQGCLKALLPKTYDGAPQAVFVNTSGGLTGGDQLKVKVDLEQETTLTLTTQAAERIYKSVGGNAQFDIECNLESGSSLYWLPQETILFDRSRLARTLTFNMAEDAQLVALETLVLGRQAMKEKINDLYFKDLWKVFINGRLKITEAVKLDDASFVNSDVCLGSNTVISTLWIVGLGFEDALAKLRSILTKYTSGNHKVIAAASALNGGLVVRLLATDSLSARDTLIPVCETFLNKPMPAVWRL